MESSAEFATAIKMGSSAVCPSSRSTESLAFERKPTERYRASSARMCARTIRCACVSAVLPTPCSRLRRRPTSGGEGGMDAAQRRHGARGIVPSLRVKTFGAKPSEGSLTRRIELTVRAAFATVPREYGRRPPFTLLALRAARHTRQSDSAQVAVPRARASANFAQVEAKGSGMKGHCDSNSPT